MKYEKRITIVEPLFLSTLLMFHIFCFDHHHLFIPVRSTDQPLRPGPTDQCEPVQPEYYPVWCHYPGESCGAAGWGYVQPGEG